MKFHTVCIVAAALTLVACKPSVPTQTDTRSMVQKTSSEGTVIPMGMRYKIKSDVMGTAREINVWTPAGYAKSDKNYPVLYVLDGGVEQDFPHISGLGQLASISGNYEELIVVGIRTQNRLAELAHPAADPRYIKPDRAGKSYEFMRYIEQEVIPFVEGKYRTGARRAVIGESLAGLFITEVFLKKPNLFTDYIAVSPSLWWDDKNLAKAAPLLLAAQGDAPRHLYLTMGDEGGTMQGGLDLLMAAITDNKPAGLKWLYVDRRESEGHSTIYHGAALDALKFTFGLPRPDYGQTPWYLIEGGQPPREDTK